MDETQDIGFDPAGVGVSLLLIGTFVWATWGAWQTLDLIRAISPLYANAEQAIWDHISSASVFEKVIFAVPFLSLTMFWALLPMVFPLVITSYQIQSEDASLVRRTLLSLKESVGWMLVYPVATVAMLALVVVYVSVVNMGLWLYLLFLVGASVFVFFKWLVYSDNAV